MHWWIACELYTCAVESRFIFVYHATLADVLYCIYYVLFYFVVFGCFVLFYGIYLVPLIHSDLPGSHLQCIQFILGNLAIQWTKSSLVLVLTRLNLLLDYFKLDGRVFPLNSLLFSTLLTHALDIPYPLALNYLAVLERWRLRIFLQWSNLA